MKSVPISSTVNEIVRHFISALVLSIKQVNLETQHCSALPELVLMIAEHVDRRQYDDHDRKNDQIEDGKGVPARPENIEIYFSYSL